MAHVRRVGDSFRVDAKRTFRGQQLRWSHYVRIDPGKTIAQNRTDAHAIGVQAERDLDAGTHPQARYDTAPARVERGTTVGDWVERVKAAKVFKTAGGRRNWVSYMDVHVLPHWRDVPLDDEHVTRLGVQAWVDGLDLAPRSARTVSGAFKTVLLDAIEEPSVPLTRSPYVRIRLPAPESTGRRALTAAEVAAICGKAPQQWQPFMWSLPFTGMRVGELLSRDVPHFSPLAGIEVPPTSARRRGQAPAGGEAGREPRRRTAGKSPAAVRRVGLCGSHRDELRAYVGGRTGGALFLSSWGRRPSYAAAYCVFVAAADAAGLGEVTPHWMRHTAKTWLRDGGCDPRAIDQWIGHASGGMELYVHVTPAMRARIPAVLEDKWAEAHSLAAAAAEAR